MRLRERVEARKRGEPVDEAIGAAGPAKGWRRWLLWAGIGAQLAALIALILEIFLLLERDFLDIDFVRLGIYTIVFFLGRVIQFFLSFTRR